MSISISDFDKVPVLKTRAEMFNRCVSSLTLDGFVLEFGVYVGHSINFLADLLPQKTLHGFDSFEGLPEDWNMDYKPTQRPKGYFALKELPKVRKNVVLHKGWFQDVLPGWLSDNQGIVSLVHIDSDLYSSAAFVLTALNSRIVPGTVILFDELSDWSVLPEGREKVYPRWEEHEWKAFQEWLTEFNRKVKPIAHTTTYQAAVIVQQ